MVGVIDHSMSISKDASAQSGLITRVLNGINSHVVLIGFVQDYRIPVAVFILRL